jgi:aminoglycoside phosphotransferase (APT) family kinase protein
MASDSGSPAQTMADAPWKALIDLPRLESWMDGQGLGAGPITDPVPLSGGTQNVLLRFARAGRQYVLRRPPQTPYRDGNETMRREARVLRALASGAARHPRLLADCPDADILGAAFYLMEPVDGFCAPQGLPPLHAGDPKLRHAMGMSVIDGLAALHRIDYRAAGLGDLGRPEGFLERQAARWMKQLESYGAYEGWNGRADIPGIEAIAGWLAAHIPTSSAPGIVHGDFQLNNVLFAWTGPQVAAIVDWELTTIGDPMIDLGFLLATWAEPDGSHPGCVEVQPWSGFPTEAELVERYAQAVGRDASQVNWFVVLACFKLGIIQEGAYARAAAGQAEREVAERLHAMTIKLFERALSRI